MYRNVLTLVTATLALVDAQAGSIFGSIVPGTTGKLGDATIISNNIIGMTYQAVLPQSTTTGFRGYIIGSSVTNGTGIVFSTNIYGFSDEAALGPFRKVYHIHESPVPSDGNCTGTGAHLDPYARGEIPPCDPSTPQMCQVGDLAGKHGNMTTSPFQATYLDLYLSDRPGASTFFGNRSLVIHLSNTTRLTCANFTLLTSALSSSSGLPPASTPTTAIPDSGSADAKVISGGVVLAGVLALLL
ncbi:hypothetical protein MMC26_000964 [Xylographa opegraphella]|nr:hypothetical protein [Xylographa opegraphella]